jgi:hypothetical protein
MKFLPGKPWIILIAFIGNMYGIIVNKALSSVDEEGNEVQSSIRPLLLQDKYPAMNAYGADIVNFGYMSAPWDPLSKVSWSGIIMGGGKVAFVAVLETLISARIADTKTSK